MFEDNTQKIYVVDFEQREHITTYEINEELGEYKCIFWSTTADEDLEEFCDDLEFELNKDYDKVAA